ncbi:GerMN domain-containing protein [Intrasporangium flavum]|uniref:GerMN domain-containing protein n=1 Tax=Intrasporangium flavum TaxID=1428657 RepID=UPI00096D1A7C|nr:GerMN domain-containing protein [Intrasporangium flavum]
MTEARRRGPHRRVPRAVLAVVAVAASLVLTACGGLPGTGPVVEGRALGDSAVEPVRVAAVGPADGASPQAVISGFLRAGEDSDETHQTGKLYLAPQSVDLWHPGTGDVVVYDGDLSFRRIDEDTLEVSTDEVARLSPDGRYEEQEQGTRAKMVLGLTKVGGEWRIELPSRGFGLWLDTDQFERTYTNQLVYYVTKTGRDLVPDSRWFPIGTRLPTTLARAQLSPVPAYLAGAVFSAVPSGTTLGVNAVPVENGQAQVILSNQALSADPDGRAAMWAQMTETLRQVSAVSSVSLAVAATTLELPGGLTSVEAAVDLGFDTVNRPPQDTALLRSGDAIYRIDPTYVPDTSNGGRRPDLKPRDGDVARVPDTWTGLALSVDGKQVAAVSTGRAELSIWSATAETRFFAPFATSLTRPSYDAGGYLWLGGQDRDGASHVYVLDSVSKDPAAKPRAVSAPWLAGRRVVAVSVSADAARALVISTDRFGRDQQLGLTGIVRSSNGEPLSLTRPEREAQSLTQLQDVTWLGPASYAVLGAEGVKGRIRPWTGTLGAGIDGRRHSAAALGEVAGAVRITTVGGPRGLVIVTSDDRVWVRAGSTWRRIENGSDVLVPGG